MLHWITPELLFWLSLGLLIYTWLGYPTILFFAERIFYRPVRKAPYEPTISILLVAHNEEENIARKLDNLLSLDYPADKRQIVVASDGSHDETATIVKEYADKGVQLLEYSQRRGKPSVLNDAMQQIGAEIVVLVDTRQRLDQDILRKLVQNFSDPEVGGVSGELMFEAANNAGVAQGMDTYWRYEKWLREKESGIHSTVGGTGAIFALRRSLYQELPASTILDDVATPMKIVRQGYRVVLELGARAWDVPQHHWEREFARKTRTLSGNFQVLHHLSSLGPRLWGPLSWQFVSHKVLRILNPLLLLVLFYTNWLLLPQGALAYSAVFWGQIAFYAFSLLGWIMQGKKVRLPFLSVCYSFMLMQVAIVTGFLRYTSGRDDVLWEKAHTLAPGSSQKRFWRLLFDSSLFCIGFVGAFYLRYLDTPPPEAFRWLTVLTPSFDIGGVTLAVPLFILIPLMTFYFFRLSESRAQDITPEYLLLLLKSILYASFGVFVCMYILRDSLTGVIQAGNQLKVVSLPSGVIFLAVLINCITIAGWRFLFFLAHHARQNDESQNMHLLLVGPHSLDEPLCHQIQRSFGQQTTLSGILTEPEKDGQTQFLRRTERFMIGRHAPDLALLDPRRLRRNTLLELVAVADEEALPVELLGGDFEILLGKTPPRLTNYIPLLDVDRQSSVERIVFLKRLLDRLAGLVLLIPGSIALLLLYIGSKIIPGWKTIRFVKVERCGIAGKPFHLRRLRAPGGIRPACLVRLARMGLLAGALLTGKLSLVGPPLLTLRQWERRHPIAKRFMLSTPGILSLRRLTANFSEMLRPRDRAIVYYARNLSLRLDLEILWQYFQRPSHTKRSITNNKE